MINRLYRLLAGARDVQAASRGPVPYGKRQVRKAAHRTVARTFRRGRWF